jgi:CRAL/TRIO, N-terminal domain
MPSWGSDSFNRTIKRASSFSLDGSRHRKAPAAAAADAEQQHQQQPQQYRGGVHVGGSTFLLSPPIRNKTERAHDSPTDLGEWGNLAYAEGDPRASYEGFHGNVTQVQEAAVAELHRLVTTAKLDLDLVRGAGQSEGSLAPVEPMRLCLLRFLRANNFSTKKAYAQLEENVNFREKEGVANLLLQAPSEVLACDPEAINEYFPHWDFGADKFNRPVLCKRYGGFVVSELVQMTTIDRMVKSHVWEQEMTLR